MPKSLVARRTSTGGSLETRVRRQVFAISFPDINAVHASSFGNWAVNVQSPSHEASDPSPTVEYFPTYFVCA